MMPTPKPPFKIAYLFERFPSFVQTFCYREASEAVRQEKDVMIYSIRPAEGKVALPEEVWANIEYLPDPQQLKELANADWKKLPEPAKELLKQKALSDKGRIYEALWLGLALKKRGIQHIQLHFGGMAARTAYWVKKFYGISYSFTAHSDDVFEETKFAITIADLIKEAALVITVSDFSLDWLQVHYPAYAGKFFRVYNGMEVPPQPAKPVRQTKERPARLISVGRLVKKKGFEHLLEACAMLRDRGVDFQCSIIGGGVLEAPLKQQLDELCLGDSVRFEGPLPFSEVREYLCQSDIFVLPCIPETPERIDNLPTVIQEAMFYGLPVVSTRLAGIPEMMEDNVTGYLLDDADPVRLADALQKMIENPERAAAMGQAGYLKAVELFSVHRTTRALLDFIYQNARQTPKTPLSWWQRLLR